MKRTKYLKITDIEKALDLWYEKIDIFADKYISSENIGVKDAYFKTLSKPVYSKRNIPPFSTSAFDGIAVRAQNTYSAREVSPIILESEKDFRYINTGDKLPGLFNAVIMIENVEEIDNNHVRIRKGISIGDNVRMVGEDIHQGDVVFYNGEYLTPEHISLLIAAGISNIDVKRKLKLVFIPTGDEITNDINEKSKILESNSAIVEGYILKWGGEIDIYDCINDNEHDIKKAIEKSLEKYDIIIVSAGSSHGSKDYTSSVLNDIGELIVHGTNIRPGKPVILGSIKEKLFIGLPGFPYACDINLKIFIGEIFKRIYNYRENNLISAMLINKVSSKIGEKHYYNTNIIYNKGKFLAYPVKTGSSNLYSGINSTGYFIIDIRDEGVEEGEEVIVFTDKTSYEIKKNLLFVGSNDPLIGELGNKLFEKHRIKMFISNKGSMGGIYAMQKGKCHISGMHLFDSLSGTYNISFVKKYLGGEGILVHLANRSQGIIVKKGNPLNIQSVKDIKIKKARYVNRQNGAGTRLMFDYLLQESDIEVSDINGYDNVVSKHIDAGYMVKEELADAAIAIELIADMLGLEFIPIFIENYDLYFSNDFKKDDRFYKIIDILKEDGFGKNIISRGYDTKNIGEIVYEG
jgi:putative molybdopterin biosynthesis protein